MIEQRLKLAEIGQTLWNSLEKQRTELEGAQVLWLCDQDLELGQLALAQLPDFLKEKGAKGVLILCLKEEADRWSQQLKALPPHPYTVVLRSMEREESEGLLAFYEMYQFTGECYIISLTKPFGRQLRPLEKILNVSKTQILHDCIYQRRV